MTLVNQYFGLGDVIYVQYLLGLFSSNEDIVFPIADEYFWITDYLQCNSKIRYIKKSECKVNLENPIPSHSYLPLRWATQIRYNLASNDYSHDHTVMEDKYLLFGVNPKHWVNYQFKRNLEKEQSLIKLLGLEDGKPITLVNNNFGSSVVGSGKSNIPVIGLGENTVEMSKIDGYTLFDWIGVIEKAESVHTVSTSLVYLVDKYSKPECNRNVYTRNNDPKSLDGIRNIMTSEWNYNV
jgi:hypothetical protein